eukprot:490871-Alexandrium_andersonii.AAC.1
MTSPPDARKVVCGFIVVAVSGRDVPSLNLRSNSVAPNPSDPCALEASVAQPVGDDAPNIAVPSEHDMSDRRPPPQDGIGPAHHRRIVYGQVKGPVGPEGQTEAESFGPGTAGP